MNSLISKCHRAFTVNAGSKLICSQCGNEIAAIDAKNDIVLEVQYTTDLDTLSVSSDKNVQIIKRFATDPTCQLTDRKCHCGAFCRYVRMDAPYYVCSNPDCRDVTK